MDMTKLNVYRLINLFLTKKKDQPESVNSDYDFKL